MELNLDDVIDGAITGQVILQVKDVELKTQQTTKGARDIISARYVILEGEPQGPNEVDPAGESVFHTIWIPDGSATPQAVGFFKKNLKEFLSAHGIEPEGNFDLADAIEHIVANKPQVGAKLGVNKYQLENNDREVTEIKSFYAV